MAKRPRSKAVGTAGLPSGRPMTDISVGTVGGLPNVQYHRPELRKVMHLYDLIRDCLDGQHAVKAKGDFYLPRPNASDQSEENLARFDAYLERAIFYNVSFRTVMALVGQIFMRDPQVDVPTNLDPLKLDANGENVSLEQIAMSLAMYAIAYGRGGIHVDFPTSLSGITQAQNANQDFRPIINAYEGRDIINWRKALRGSRMVYTLIVVSEVHTLADDGFEAKSAPQFKVMRLVPAGAAAQSLASLYPDTWEEDYGQSLATMVSLNSDVYRIEIWRSAQNTAETTVGGTGFGIAEVYYPRDHQGNLLNEIPWQFVGSDKNDDSIDKPPIADMCEINIGHYHNSADYEESVFVIGQPTPFVSGVTEEWNNNVLKGNIQLGSRGVIALPNGGTAGLLQADPNTLAFEAMGQKERQMVALGAKLVEQRQVQRTATEAQMEGSADTSILANIAQNVSTAVEWGLKKACVFTGDDPDSVSFILNTEFDLTRMDPAERQQLLLEYQGGSITFSEMRSSLRRAGIATLDDKEAQTQIQAEEAMRQAAELEKLAAVAKINTKPVQPGGGQQPAPAAGSGA